jgi:oxygen-independent coproporphyrinogen-3 oxidase
MISLRTIEGINLETIKTNWGSEKAKTIEGQLSHFNTQGLVIVQNNKVRLTDKGMLKADGIAAHLFVSER